MTNEPKNDKQDSTSQHEQQESASQHEQQESANDKNQLVSASQHDENMVEFPSETREVPSTIAHDQSSYLGGCGITIVGLILCGVLSIVLSTALSNIPTASNFPFMVFPIIGIASFVVWIVFIVRSFASGKKRFALGLLTVGAVAFLLVAACFGLVFGSLIFMNN